MLQFIGYDNNAYKVATSTTPFTGLTSGWHDFDMVFDGTNGYLYIDGVLEWTSPDFTSGKIKYHASNSLLVWGEVAGGAAPTSSYFKWNVGNIVIQNSSEIIDATGALNTITAPYQNMTLYAAWEPTKTIMLEATATQANQTLKINKYFANEYTVDWWDGSPIEAVSADKSHTYSDAWTYIITLSTTSDRWTFQNVRKPLVPKDGTSMTWVNIIYMQ